MPALTKALQDKDEDVRIAAVLALGIVGKEAVPVLLPMLKDKEVDVRLNTVNTLGKLGADSFELVTVYRGKDASDDELAKLESDIRSTHPGLEVEVQQGDQQHYPFILSVE